MTAASMGGAVKQLVESLGLGVAAYRDGAPTTPQGTNPAPPYVVVTEAIALAAHPAAGVRSEVDVEQIQVDLYQEARRASGTGGTVNVESYTLPETIRAALIGRGLEPYAPWHVWDTTVAVRRWPPSDNLVRHTMTLTVTRTRDRKAA